MKILQINSCFRRGSTGKIVACIHDFLIKTGNESIVCWERKGNINEKNTFKLAKNEFIAKAIVLKNRLMGLQYKGSIFYTRRLLHYIREEKPDVVHIHCINSGTIDVYKLLEYLGEMRVPTVITLHAEFFYTGNCGHAYECDQWKHGCLKCKQGFTATHSYFFDRSKTAWERMHKAMHSINKHKALITSVSPWLTERAKQSDIINHLEIETVFNPVDNNIFKPCSISKIDNFKLDNNIPFGKKVIFHPTASFTPFSSTTLKGGNFIIQLAELLKYENIVIVVAAINANITQALPENIIFIGKINNQNVLATAYSTANLSLIVSKRETFSMICAESLMCGTPIVGFKAGGPESISLSEYSFFVDYSNIQALCRAIHNTIDLKNVHLAQEISKKANSYFSLDSIGKRYVNYYKRLLSK
jgi:putative colanic acid biosynthesis glycosyltransferase